MRCSSRRSSSAALLAGCGDDDTEAVTELLDKAFESSIGSADITLDIEVELDGVDELEDPIEITLTGPYDSARGGARSRSVDWDITVSAQNQSFNANLTSTGDRAFVGFQGTDYEVSQETVDALNRQLAASEEQEGGRDLSDFGVSARDWVVDAEEEGDEDVAGVETTHVSGKLDVTRVLEDLNTVVQEAAKLGGQLGQQAPPALTDEQKDQIEEVVDDPGFDAYVGKDDDMLHRLSADLEFDVPEDSRDQVGGLEGGRISFSIEFANIGSAAADRGARGRAADRRADPAAARPARRRARRSPGRRAVAARRAGAADRLGEAEGLRGLCEDRSERRVGQGLLRGAPPVGAAWT